VLLQLCHISNSRRGVDLDLDAADGEEGSSRRTGSDGGYQKRLGFNLLAQDPRVSINGDLPYSVPARGQVLSTDPRLRFAKLQDSQ
jgi:hypothetical protein